MATDLYAILGVSPSATRSEITQAYRILVRRHHPDTRSPDPVSPTLDDTLDDTDDDAARHDTALQDVVDAYRVLHDPVRRAAYDRRRQPRRLVVRRAQPPVTPQAPMTDSQPPPIIAGPVYWQRPRAR